MSDSDYLNNESSEGSESDKPTAIVAASIRDQPSDGPSVGAVVCAINALGVVATAPVLASDVQAPAAVAAAAVGGRGKGCGSRGCGCGA